jgi:hypothetical protein
VNELKPRGVLVFHCRDFDDLSQDPLLSASLVVLLEKGPRCWFHSPGNEEVRAKEVKERRKDLRLFIEFISLFL